MMSEENIRGILKKLDDIQKDITSIKVTIAGMPCDSHRERTSGIQKAQNLQWGVIGAVLVGIIGLAFKSLSAR